jgi:DnaJ-class molecular chaperone
LFEELFTGRRRGPKRGANMQYRLRLTFMEAVHGVKKKLVFQYQVGWLLCKRDSFYSPKQCPGLAAPVLFYFFY